MNARGLSMMVVVVLSLGFAPAPFPKTERAEHADMIGVWRSGNSEQMRITADRMTLSYKTERPWPYDLTFDANVRPATFELRGVPGSPTADSHWRGIYRVRGGVLTFCYN